MQVSHFDSERGNQDDPQQMGSHQMTTSFMFEGHSRRIAVNNDRGRPDNKIIDLSLRNDCDSRDGLLPYVTFAVCNHVA